LTIVIKLDII